VVKVILKFLLVQCFVSEQGTISKHQRYEKSKHIMVVNFSGAMAKSLPWMLLSTGFSSLLVILRKYKLQSTAKAPPSTS
jgi:hypothetical protein